MEFTHKYTFGLSYAVCGYDVRSISFPSITDIKTAHCLQKASYSILIGNSLVLVTWCVGEAGRLASKINSNFHSLPHRTEMKTNKYYCYILSVLL